MNASDWQDRIEARPTVLVGKPVVRGTRVSVEMVLDVLAEGETVEQVAKAFRLESDDVRACLAWPGRVAHRAAVGSSGCL